MKRSFLVVLAAASTLTFASCQQQPAEEQMPATQEELPPAQPTPTPTPAPTDTMMGTMPTDTGMMQQRPDTAPTGQQQM
ncbi:MAG TPA: hypothetical protein VIL18_05140 [Longimicrobiales bacterium]